jgi:hypothetical protein
MTEKVKETSEALLRRVVAETGCQQDAAINEVQAYIETIYREQGRNAKLSIADAALAILASSSVGGGDRLVAVEKACETIAQLDKAKRTAATSKELAPLGDPGGHPPQAHQAIRKTLPPTK